MRPEVRAILRLREAVKSMPDAELAAVRGLFGVEGGAAEADHLVELLASNPRTEQLRKTIRILISARHDPHTRGVAAHHTLQTQPGRDVATFLLGRGWAARRKTFDQAVHLAHELAEDEVVAKLEALGRGFEKLPPVHLPADQVGEILEAVRLAERHGLIRTGKKVEPEEVGDDHPVTDELLFG